MSTRTLIPAFCISAAALCASGRTASARSSRVALVQPPAPDPLLAEATTRVRAELAAAGFDVAVLESAPDQDPQTLVESAGLDPPPVATLMIVRMEAGARADIWLEDRLTGKTLVRHVDVSGLDVRRAPSVLSVRAVELLRASLLEATEPPHAESSRPMPPDVARWVAPKRYERPSSETRAEEERRDTPALRAELGASVLSAVRGARAAFAPLLRVGYGTASWSGRISVVAPAFGSELESDAGTAAVRQELAEAEIVGAWPARSPFSAVASLGIGAYHAHVQGSATPPYVARKADQWGFVGDAGVGAAFRFGARSGLLADMHALLVTPSFDVRIGDAVAGGTSHPAYLVTLGFWEAF